MSVPNRFVLKGQARQTKVPLCPDPKQPSIIVYEVLSFQNMFYQAMISHICSAVQRVPSMDKGPIHQRAT